MQYARSSSRTIGIVIVLGLLAPLVSLVVPTASAAPAPAPLGINMPNVKAIAAAGAPVKYGSFWVGPWMATSGWGGLDSALDTAKAAGVTPVLYWYYWGDSISPSCVDNGCGGKSQAQWSSMTQTLADHVRAKMAGAETLIVLENEFNKGGIDGAYAPTFDAKLETVAKTLKTVPGVKLILGFGNWGESNWVKFPKSAAQSEYIGFQMMRASTKDTESSYRAAATRTVALTNHVATTFAKPSFLYDLALSSYPDASWETIQAETLQAIFDGLSAPGAATGLQGIVYRSMKDTNMDPANYYGYAEQHWGLQTMDGAAKPAWNVWKAVATSAPAPAAAPAPAPTPYNASFDASKGGNAWWVEVALTATATTSAVCASVNDSASCQALAHQSWGAWAASIHAGPGSKVVFTATGADGTRVTSSAYAWPSGAAYVAPPPNAPPTAEFTATGGVLSATVDAAASSDPEGSALSYAWDYGDGQSGSGVRASHAYQAAGSYTITLTVSDGELASSKSATVAVAAPNKAPVASFTAQGGVLNATVDASASSDPEGSALSYAWDFGDGQTGSGARASHAYAAAGNYTITLTVSDGDLASTAVQTVTVAAPNRAPVASFTAQGGVLNATLDATASSDPEGGALSYAWNFGDGQVGSGAKTTHAYQAAGNYTVTLTVSDGDLATTKTATVSVAAPPPPPKYAATFATNGGNDWWVAVTVTANAPTSSVCAIVNDGATCQALKLQSWGEWAASFNVPANAKVVFRATSTTGASVTSGAYAWPSGAAYVPPATATFGPSGNEWWVQTTVTSNAKITSVCASVNGGACQALKLQSWGAWAASIHAVAGSKVVFTATTGTGQRIASPTFTWK